MGCKFWGNEWTKHCGKLMLACINFKEHNETQVKW